MVTSLKSPGGSEFVLRVRAQRRELLTEIRASQGTDGVKNTSTLYKVCSQSHTFSISSKLTIRKLRQRTLVLSLQTGSCGFMQRSRNVSKTITAADGQMRDSSGA